jgi:hypothetical protein
MPARTSLFQMLPWVGGLNTSLDESTVPPNQCTQLDNVIFATRGSKKKREGISHNWDSGTTASASILALQDYWFGSNAKTQRLVGVSSARNVYSYSNGTRSTLTVNGAAWSGTLDSANMLTFNNKCLIAVSGSSNLVKYWDGSSGVEDLRSTWNQQVATTGRSSAGTTRTIILTKSFYGQNGDKIVVELTNGANAAYYNGTYTVTSVTTSSLTNDTITYEGPGSLTEAGTGDATMRVHGVAPAASILREHLGRIWCNDKTNVDRLHFSSAGNHQEWLGFGDSGAIDIGVGDGDPDGITAIFPSFRGELFVAKRTKLYRISGFAPETFQVSLVSAGIGCVSHASAVAVDQDDVYFCSEKGIHSLQTTANFGDFQAAFASGDIQTTFNDDLVQTRFKYTQAGYLSTINSIAFTVTDNQYGNSAQNSILLYNVPLKAWYRWPNLSCQALCVANDPDKKRFYLGTSTTRVSKTFNGLNYDVSAAGASASISYRIVTGLIFPDESPYMLKSFRRFILYYRPTGRHTITATVKIDNISLSPENSLQFQQTTGGTPLGTGFVLGSTPLGSSLVFGPQTRQIDGMGRGCKISIEQSGVDEEVEIQGWAIEFEPAGTNSEVY